DSGGGPRGLSRCQAHLRDRREASGHRRLLAGRGGRFAGARGLGLSAGNGFRAGVARLPDSHYPEALRMTVANLPTTMTIIQARQPGGPDVLEPTTRAVPAPGPGEVLVKVAAA